MKFKLRPFFKDIFLTFITQAVILIAFFFIYRLIAVNFGPEGVGEYSLIKRIIAFLQPVLLLGLGIGIPRYIAMSQNREQRSGYIKAGGLVVAIFSFVFLTFINLFKDYFAKLFFGTADYSNLVLPFSLFLAGLTLHALVYSYFRGRLFVKTFNFFQIINLALVPLIILIFFKNITIEKLITLIGITTFVVAFIFSLFLVKELFVPIKKWQFFKPFKELFQYSLPRVPAIFAWQGLLSLGPILAIHFTSIREVGYLSVGQSLLGTVGAAIAPLGLIILPKVSTLIVNGRQEVIKENLNFLLGAILQCSVFICFQLIIFTDVIVEYWLGSEFSGAISIMRIVFLAVFFYALFEAMRNILDAVKVKPINTINLFISLGVFLIIGGILLFLIELFSPIISLSIALTSAISCLGTLTYNSIRKIYPEKLKKDLNYLWIAVLINVLLGSIAIFAKSFVVSKFYYLVLFEVLVGVIYLSILWFLKMEWIREIPKRILS
ncbi:MAG: lipopolysaccharide biosynthesis protein [Candidatus Pacebacteria bacterium]|nr:lipopolysaccharide biosynthesis protein [Candidatus Paceibacterota bacterium]